MAGTQGTATDGEGVGDGKAMGNACHGGVFWVGCSYLGMVFLLLLFPLPYLLLPG